MYKEKPSDYKMTFLNINPNFKYLGGIGEKQAEYKRIPIDEYSIFEDESIRKKVRREDHIDYENDAINTIEKFRKMKYENNASNKMDEEKTIEIKIDNTNYSGKIFGKIEGITKKT